MLSFGKPDGQRDFELYSEIRQKAPKWFLSCLGLDNGDSSPFILWLHSFRVTWLRSENAVVFLVSGTQKHVIEAHLALFAPSDVVMPELRKLLDWVFMLGWKRVEIPVTSNAGRTIRRMMTEMGFRNEGTLRAAQHGHDMRLGREAYLDVEMWAILAEGVNHGV